MGLEYLLGKGIQVKPWRMHMTLLCGHQECMPSEGNRKSKASNPKGREIHQHTLRWGIIWMALGTMPWSERSSGSQFASFKMQHKGPYWYIIGSREPLKVLCSAMIIQAVFFKACSVWWSSFPHWEYFYGSSQEWMCYFVDTDFHQSWNVIIFLRSMVLQGLLPYQNSKRPKERVAWIFTLRIKEKNGFVNKVKVAFVSLFIYLLFIYAHAVMRIKCKPMHLLSKYAVIEI